MPKYEEKYLEINGAKVPLRIYKEWRRTTRISMASKNVILRIPTFLSSVLLKSELKRVERWCELQFKKHPELLNKYAIKQYKTGDEITAMNETFVLDISKESRKSGSGKYKNGKIIIKVPLEISDVNQSDMIRKLTSRTIAKALYSRFSKKVHNLNEEHFGKTINDIRLKYNRTNWGSCSTNQNLNFSTRLLLAPAEVIDYVIVHELSHLVEMNHSKRFWNVVKKAMPDYLDQEAWLKNHGHTCNF